MLTMLWHSWHHCHYCEPGFQHLQLLRFLLNVHTHTHTKPVFFSIGTSDYRITFPEAHLQIPTDNLSSLHDKLKSKSLPRPLSCHLDSPSGVRKVPIFTIPRGGTSPMSSPILSRRKKRFSCASPRISPKPLKKELHNKENLLHAWMDGKGNEVTHWQAVMDNPGEWVYCWHLLRHNLTPAHQW